METNKRGDAIVPQMQCEALSTLVDTDNVRRPGGEVGNVAKHHDTRRSQEPSEVRRPVKLCGFIVEATVWMTIEAVNDNQA